MMRPRLLAAREVLRGDRGDLRQHRRQRGGAPAAADGRGVRGAELPGPGRGQPQRQGPPARQGLRHQPRVPPRLRPSTRPRACSTPAAPTPSTSATSRCRRRRVGASGTCRCATPTRSSTRSPRGPCTSRCGATPSRGGSPRRRSTVPSRSQPVFGDGKPAVWRWSRPRIDERPDDLVCRRIKGKHGERVDVFQKDWLHRDADGGRRKKLRTIWLAEEVGSTDTAVAELKEIVGHVFESPKPTGLIRRILGTMPTDAVVLDFFAGSGTTGHAVALQNAEDGGSRRCLSINSAEPTRDGSNARAAGLLTRRRHHPGPADRRRRAGRWRARAAVSGRRAGPAADVAAARPRGRDAWRRTPGDGCRCRAAARPARRRRRRPSGSRATPNPAATSSATRSRLSIRWVTCGTNPASEARVRSASSSAVCREFTIQEWSAYADRSAGAGSPAGTPRPHSADQSGVATRSPVVDSGARS